MAEKEKPLIVVKRIKKVAGGHHGGAWKIAYADFVTAMMAFFLLMWLLSSVDKDKLKGIAEYFSTPLLVAMTGGNSVGQSAIILDGGGKDPNAKAPGGGVEENLDAKQAQERAETAQMESMKSKLEKMGFSVTLLTDATRLTMERQMVDYVNSLNPGDISFFYFSGHGTQHHGVNYLVPVDAAPQLNDFVSINKLMQMQRDKSILASIIMTDACRKGTLYETGFDSTGSSRNTYIALAAAAGEESIDGIPNGVFTTRVLKHITAEKDIDTIFNTIKAEMARDPSVKQHPTSINFLEEPIVLAVQKTPPRPTALNSSVTPAPHDQQAGRNNQCIHTRISSDPDFDRQGLLNQCIGEFFKIKDDVIEDRQMAAQAQSQLAEQLKLRFSDDQFNPIYFFNYLWSSQVVNLPESGLSNTKPIYRSALLTLLIWFILAGGLIYREHLDEAQNAYREFRVDEENHQLHVIYQKYSLLADEAMQKFKDKLRQAITAPTLLKPDLATHLPNPFAEDEDVANRKNASYLTEQEAIDHLKKVLGST